MPADAKGAEHLRDWVGLRPGRTAVRVERERVRGKKGRGKEVEVSRDIFIPRWRYAATDGDHSCFFTVYFLPKQKTSHFTSIHSGFFCLPAS